MVAYSSAEASLALGGSINVSTTTVSKMAIKYSLVKLRELNSGPHAPFSPEPKAMLGRLRIL